MKKTCNNKFFQTFAEKRMLFFAASIESRPGPSESAREAEPSEEEQIEQADRMRNLGEKITQNTSKIERINQQIDQIDRSGTVAEAISNFNKNKLRRLKNMDSVADAVHLIFGTGYKKANRDKRAEIWNEIGDGDFKIRDRQENIRQNTDILNHIKERVNDQIRLRKLREERTKLENEMHKLEFELAEREISEEEPDITDITDEQTEEMEFKTEYANFKIKIVEGNIRLTREDENSALDLPYQKAAGIVFRNPIPNFKEKYQTFTRMVVLYDLAFNEIGDTNENRTLREAMKQRIESYMRRLATQIGDKPENIFNPEIAERYGFRKEEAPAVATAPTTTPLTPRAATPTASPVAPEAAQAEEPAPPAAAPAAPAAAPVAPETRERPEYEESPDLIPGKEYFLNRNTPVYITSANPSTIISRGEKVTVSRNLTMDVGEETRVLIRTNINGDEREGWIPKSNINIPPEDKYRFPSSPPETTMPSQERNQFEIAGTFNLSEVDLPIRGSELLQELFEQNLYGERLRTSLEESGVSPVEYLNILQKAREGNTLHIIIPSQTFEAALEEFSRQAQNPEYESYLQTRNERIFQNRENYLTEVRRIENQDLIDYANNERAWNDLWERRGQERNSHIRGLQRAVHSLGELGISDNEARDILRDLIRRRGMGIRESSREGALTFRQIYNNHIKGKIEIGGQKYEKSFRQFQEEINGLTEELEQYTDEDFEKMNRFRELTRTIDEWRGGNHGRQVDPSAPYFKEWDTLSRETINGRPIQQVYTEVMRKKLRHEELTTKILYPAANLMDAIEQMEVRISPIQTFENRHRRVLSRMDAVQESDFEIGGPFFNIEHLERRRDQFPERIDFSEENPAYSVGLTTEVREQLDEILRTRISEENLRRFGDGPKLKLVFQLYSFETLINEGCLTKLEDNENGKNRFLLTKLPETFNAKNENLSLLFELFENGRISTPRDLDRESRELAQIAERLDSNAAMLARLTQIFGDADGREGGPQVYNYWRERIRDFLSTENEETFSLTIADIGAGEVTLPVDDFMNTYMSGNAALLRISQQIAEHGENGVQTYNADKLSHQLTERLELGMTFIFTDPQFEPIRTSILGEFGGPEDPNARQSALSAYIENLSPENLANPSYEIPEKAIELIRIGEVYRRIREAHSETPDLETRYSGIPQIRELQEALDTQAAERQEAWTNQDMKELETLFRVGFMITPGEGGSVSAGAEVYRNGDFSILAGGTVGTEGVSAGLAGRYEIKKDDKKVADIVLSAGTGYIGVGGNKVIELENWDVGIHGGVAATAIGLTAGGGIGVMRNTDREMLRERRSRFEERGITNVVNLLEAGGNPQQIREAIFDIPDFGEELKSIYETLSENENFSNQNIDNFLIEAFQILRRGVDTEVQEEILGAARPRFEGAGIWGGTVNGRPTVIVYASISIGRHKVTVRETAPGYDQLWEESDAIIQGDLLENMQTQYGDGLIQTNLITLARNGRLMMDDSGRPAISSEPVGEAALRAVSITDQVRTNLERINVDVEFNPQRGEIFIAALTPGSIPQDIKYLVDPQLRHDGIKIVEDPNGIRLVGVDRDLMRELRITRENFHYPFERRGTNSISAITIKRNPVRTRTMIERESPVFFYQRSGEQLQTHQGLVSDEALGVRVLSPEAYDSLQQEGVAPTGRFEMFDQKDFNEFRELQRRALNVINLEEREQTPRIDTGEFAQSFLSDSSRMTQFRRLTTSLTEQDGEPDFEEVASLMQGFARTDESIGRGLSAQELNEVYLHAVAESFLQTEEMSEEDIERVLENHLNIAINRVFRPLFEEIGIEEANINQMLDQIRSDIGEGRRFDREGALFSSMVGMEGIVGLRGTTNYSPEMRKEIGEHLINFTNYSPSEPGVRGQLGRAFLEILSPLETKDDSEFMNSRLAREMAANEGIYLLLGSENAKKVMNAFEAREVTEDNREAFKEFKDLVSSIREAQLNGSNTVNYGEAKIRIDSEVGLGTYNRCQNPSIAAVENITIQIPERIPGQATEEHTYVNITAETQLRQTSLGVAARFREPEPPPPPTPEEEVPEAGPGGETGAGGSRAETGGGGGRPETGGEDETW